MSGIYGYETKNFKTEEKLSPLGVEFLKEQYPKAEIKLVPSYTVHDKSTKYLQDNHIDCIMKLRGNIFTFDFKCTNSDTGYYKCAILEIYKQRLKGFQLQTIQEGWIEYAKGTELPYNSQYIMRICDNEIILFNKYRIHETIKKFPQDFMPTELRMDLDSGNKSSEKAKGNILYDYNKYLYYNEYRHVMLLKDMKAKKYHKIKNTQLNGNEWVEVELENTGNVYNTSNGNY